MEVLTSEIKKRKLGARTLAYVRNVGPYMQNAELFSRLFGEVMSWATPKGLMQNPEMEAISVYHDDPYLVPENEQRISVGFTVPEGTEGEGKIQIMALPAGEHVVGSFEILPSEYGYAWKEVFEFIEAERLNPSEVMYESYRNDPHTHPEGKHLVDVCVMLG